MTRAFTVTDQQIAQLREEAIAAGDWDQAIICNRALDGSQRARRLCAKVIADAHAAKETAR